MCHLLKRIVLISCVILQLLVPPSIRPIANLGIPLLGDGYIRLKTRLPGNTRRSRWDRRRHTSTCIWMLLLLLPSIMRRLLLRRMGEILLLLLLLWRRTLLANNGVEFALELVESISPRHTGLLIKLAVSDIQ